MEAMYCALSHCWGAEDRRPIRTTKATLNSHLKGIGLEQLPASFRDAITVTRAIGVRYLWVDSLCIVQDDKVDWKKEAKTMGKLYENAVLTIAASGAKDCHEGCFISKSADCPSHRVQLLPPADSSLQPSHFYLHQVFDTSPMWGPLSKRGWVVQEWYLSRRIAHFTRGGIFWKCKRDEKDEYEGPKPPSLLFSWSLMMENYSIALFTYPDDQLIALEGLITEMRATRQDSYSFGHWTADCPQSLLWSRRYHRFTTGNLKVPTWSWASNIGAKMFWNELYYSQPLPSVGKNVISVDNNGVMQIGDCHLAKSRACTVSSSRRKKLPLPVKILYTFFRHKGLLGIIQQISDDGRDTAQGLIVLDQPLDYIYNDGDDAEGALEDNEETDPEDDNEYEEDLEPDHDEVGDTVNNTTFHCLLVNQSSIHVTLRYVKNLFSTITSLMEKNGNEDFTLSWFLALQPQENNPDGEHYFKRVGMGISLSGPEDGGWTNYSRIHLV